jgi:hypothetical protein
MAKVLRSMIVENLDSGVVHAAIVDEGGHFLSWCGRLQEDGESRFWVYEGPRSLVSCKRCGGTAPVQKPRQSGASRARSRSGVTHYVSLAERRRREKEEAFIASLGPKKTPETP